MKGLMKNFRFIFQMFEEEEEEEKEMQIGLPTDVKHVAHIGWDGPSVNSPSWMDDFKSAPPENTSSTVAKGDTDKGVEETDNWGSQESITKKGVKESSGRNLPTLPKSSRRQPSIDSMESADSPVESPTQKSKPSKRRSKKKESNNSRELETSNSNELPNIPKKSRRKESKDNDGSVKSSSYKSREKGSRYEPRYESDDGSVSKKYDD